MSLRMHVAVLGAAVVTTAMGFAAAVSPGGGSPLGTAAPTPAAPTPAAPTPAAATPAAATPATAVPLPTPTPATPQPSAEATPVGPPVYLTFDDGPDPETTPQILDLLAAHKAKATFFAQGSQVQAHPELARRIVAEGHSLQNHTWNHPRLTELTKTDIAYGQLQPTNDAITAASGTTPTCLRAPYGATGPAVYSAAAAVGLEVVGWHLNPADYNNPGATAIAQHVLANVSAGTIVLLHDAGSGDRQQTVDALAAMLPEMSARGLAPAALCQQ